MFEWLKLKQYPCENSPLSYSLSFLKVIKEIMVAQEKKRKILLMYIQRKFFADGNMTILC